MTESTFAPLAALPSAAPMPPRSAATRQAVSAGTTISTNTGDSTRASTLARQRARVSLLDTLILALHQQAMALDPAAPGALTAQTALGTTLNPLVAELTQELLREAVISPGELAVMHQRARQVAFAALGAGNAQGEAQDNAGCTRPVPIRAVAWAKPA
jgi:BRCT domain type II-containing protein